MDYLKIDPIILLRINGIFIAIRIADFLSSGTVVIKRVILLRNIYTVVPIAVKKKITFDIFIFLHSYRLLSKVFSFTYKFMYDGNKFSQSWILRCLLVYHAFPWLLFLQSENQLQEIR